MRKLQSRSNNYLFVFDSMTEMVEFTDHDLYKMRDPDWVGEDLKTWEDVEKRTKESWDFGADIVESFVERLKKEEMECLKSKVRKTKFSQDDGDDMDWERMMNGEAFWRTTSREDREGPNEITIITDTSTSYDKDTEDILWRGGAALALTQILESRGYQVELWATNGSRLFSGKIEGVMTCCCLKHPGDAFDLSTMCNTLAGWFYRSSTFATLETICKMEGVAPAMGYGSVYPPTPIDLDELTPDYCRIFISGVYSFSAAAKVVIDEVAKLASKHSEDFKV